MRILVSEAGAPKGEEVVGDFEITNEAEQATCQRNVVGFSFGSSSPAGVADVGWLFELAMNLRKFPIVVNCYRDPPNMQVY